MNSGRFYRNSPSRRDAILERRIREIESGNWEEKVALHRKMGWPPPIGGGLPVKDRYAMSLGLGGVASGWDIPDLVEYDFSLGNIAAASTVPGMIIGLMPTSNSGFIGSSDWIGASLASANGNRVAGTGAQPYAVVLSCYIFARTSAGAVYAPGAGSTMQLVVASLSGSTNASDTLTSAQTLSALTNYWTQQTISAPASRQLSLTGTVLAAANVFYGDALFGQLVVTGALNIQGNTLSMVLEMA